MKTHTNDFSRRDKRERFCHYWKTTLLCNLSKKLAHSVTYDDIKSMRMFIIAHPSSARI